MIAIRKTTDDRPALWRSILSSRWFWVAIILFLTVLLTLFFILMRDPPLQRGMNALVSACSEARALEPRLSGGFKWARMVAGDDASAITQSRDFKTARDLIEKEALETESPEALHAYGRLLAIRGKREEARVRLRKVVSSQPQNVQAINDLGVCFFQDGKLEDALEQFDRALEIEPESREPLFNRAVCLKGMMLTQASISEFEQVTRLEGENGWGKEALERIEELSRPPGTRLGEGEVIRGFESALAEGNLDGARKIADENFEVLTRYALIELSLEHLNAAVSGDRTRSQSALEKMEAIGKLFRETKEDRYIADSAEYLRKLPEKKQASELRLINDYIEAIKASNSSDPKEQKAAYTRLAGLAEAFHAHGNLMRAHRAEIRIAKYHYLSNNLKACKEILNRIQTAAEQNRWLYDLADIYAHLGISLGRTGNNSLALRLCLEARNILQKMRERQLESKVLQFLSVIHGQVGSLDLALLNSRESLKMAPTTQARPVELAFTYFEIANLYRRRGNHKLALQFSEQALSFAEEARDVNRTAQIHSLMGLEQIALRQREDAELSLHRSLSFLGAIDAGQRVYTEPLIYLQAGQIALSSSAPAKAIDYFTKADVLSLKAQDNRFLLIRSLSGRAAANAALGNADLARTDVVRIMEIIESYRANIEESRNRSSFLEASQNAFDLAISLNLTSFGNPRAAYELSERARGRALLDEVWMRRKRPHEVTRSPRANPYETAASLNLDQVRAALPKDLTLVQYSVSENETYIFVVTRSGFSVRTSTASSELLDRLVRQSLAELRSPSSVEQFKEQARELYAYLIKPVSDLIPHNSSVCIVPDKVLHFLPFAALVDEKSEYLINSYSLSYAPSASVLVHCIEEEKKKVRSEYERIAAIGNPLFDVKRFKNLNPLPDAEVEASESALFYDNPIVLKGQDATEPRVLAAMMQCDVAHLALHCLVEEESPWLAALVLANTRPAAQQAEALQAASNDDGMLQLEELYNINLPQTRLVVLSACQTAMGQYYRGEGIVSLVRPFLSSGVPTVVASLWPVHERATSSLMIDFHKQRKQSGNSISEALRATQIKMSNGGTYEHPYYWAPFIAIGSAN